MADEQPQDNAAHRRRREKHRPAPSRRSMVAKPRGLLGKARAQRVRVLPRHPRKTSSGSQDPSWDGRSSTSSPQFQVAEWNGHKHEDVPTTTSWVYLVQYVAGAEAWETTATDAMVFYSPPYSYKKYDQTFGRIDRLNTPFYDLHYYLLKADSPIDKAVFKSLESQKDFNEQGLREAMWGIGG
jgi:hypothetical protein